MAIYNGEPKLCHAVDLSFDCLVLRREIHDNLGGKCFSHENSYDGEAELFMKFTRENVLALRQDEKTARKNEVSVKFVRLT